jgi:hypothetical protein
MKTKMMFMALPLALSTALAFADNLQTGVINSDTIDAPIRAALVDPEGYKGGEFAPASLKKGTQVRVERTSERYAYMGVELVQVIPVGQSTPVWTYADKVALTPQ